jgi:hypothetical protein
MIPRRWVVFLWFCLFLLPATVHAQTQEILPLSSDVYDEIDALYLLRGLGTPSTARPWTVTEALAILGRIDNSTLSPREGDLYDRIAAGISRPLRFSLDNLARFDAGLDIALEAYVHTNSSDYVLEEDWVYGYEERRPLLRLSLEMTLGSWFYVFTDLRYGRNRFDEKDRFRETQDLDQGIGAESSFSQTFVFPWMSWAYSRHFLSNIPGGTREFDFDWPKRAEIVFGGARWNLSFARDRLRWGRGHSGDFVVDSHRDYDEFLRFSAFSDRFKYEWLNVFYTGPESEGWEAFKFLMAHRLEFRLLPSLVLALSENLMYQPGTFNPRYLNPAFIFHNWYDRSRFNALAQMELDFTVHKGYRLYVQTAFDQIQAFWEDDSEPPSWGALGGIEHIRFAGPGLLTLSLEGAYTTPLMYRRDQVDFITTHASYVNGVPDSLYFGYTGYPYGGDAMVLRLDSSYRFPGSALVSASLYGIIHGKMNFFISHNDDGNNSGLANLHISTPSGSEGEREYTLGVSLLGKYTLPQKLSVFTLSAWAETDFVIKKNKLMRSGTGTGEAMAFHKKGSAADFQFIIGLGIEL